MSQDKEKDRSLTLRPEYTLPYGKELKRAARIGLAIALVRQKFERRKAEEPATATGTGVNILRLPDGSDEAVG